MYIKYFYQKIRTCIALERAIFNINTPANKTYILILRDSNIRWTLNFRACEILVSMPEHSNSSYTCIYLSNHTISHLNSSEASMHLSTSLTSLNQNNAILRCHMWNEIDSAVTKNGNRKEDTQTQILLMMASSTTSRLGDFFLSNIVVLKSFFDFLNQKPELRKDQIQRSKLCDRNHRTFSGISWPDLEEDEAAIEHHQQHDFSWKKGEGFVEKINTQTQHKNSIVKETLDRERKRDPILNCHVWGF